LPFNVYGHMFHTPYEFYHSTSQSAPVYVTSPFQHAEGAISTAAGSPKQYVAFSFCLHLSTLQ
jgi:hypothetical protein